MNPNTPPAALDDGRLRYEMLVIFMEAVEEGALGVDLVERAGGLGADAATLGRVAQGLAADGLITETAPGSGSYRIARAGVNRVAAANRAGEDTIP